MLAALLTCATLIGGGDPPIQTPPETCPNQIVDPQKGSAVSTQPQTCGTSVSATVLGVGFKTPINTCPLFITVVPPHSGTKFAQNSHTYTLPVRSVPVIRIDYQCVGHWILGIIPIEVSSSCQKMGEKNISSVTHYDQFPCTSKNEC